VLVPIVATMPACRDPLSPYVPTSRVDASTHASDASRVPGPPWYGDASDLVCYPIDLRQLLWDYTFVWSQGTTTYCDFAFGFTVADAGEQALAEAYLGHACTNAFGPTICEVFPRHIGPPTREHYETVCAVEAALGPRDWVCAQGE